jgi:hypothetical protein
MKGTRDILKLLKAGDQKWNVNDYEYIDLINSLCDEDLEVVKALDNIGEGELSAIGLIRQHESRVNEFKPRELAKDFYESVMYGFCMINYEEMRHGFILKELATLANTGNSFIDNVDASYLHGLMFETNEIYNDPYESLMSLLIGEITNVELYASVERQVKNVDMQQIVNRIKVDEQKHKDAWYKIIKRMVDTNETHRVNFINAFKNIHFVHQAEISNYFKDGANSVQRFFTPSVSTFVVEEKFKFMTKIFGESPISKKQMLKEQILHVHKVLAA